MTKILLIRHGQSANNALPEPQRVCDPGLTEMGIRQAAATAEYLKWTSLDGLYCSPFLRSLETTRPIAEARGVPVAIRHNLFEQGGCYSGYDAVGKRGEPGLGHSQLRASYPGWLVDEQIADSGWWGKDYETPSEARIRAKQVASWILDNVVPLGGTHAFVIHADFKALFLATLRAGHGFPTSSFLWNTGISELSWEQSASWQPGDINAIGHLPEDLRTR